MKSLAPYSLYIYDCVATINSTTITKFAKKAVVVSLITDNNEKTNLEKMVSNLKKKNGNLESWCQRNKLLIIIGKTKELMLDFSTNQERNNQVHVIHKNPLERVGSF